MTILPKVLYHFHTIPVHVPFFYVYFRIGVYPLSGLISIPEFRATPSTDRLQGGLGVPNLANYGAAQISQLPLLHATWDIFVGAP